MKIYENVIIGNFLYALGLNIGLHQNSTNKLSAINLLQQTPADKSLGDVLLEYPGVVRLIEFKNKKSDKKKEKVRLKELSYALSGDNHMQNISKEIHWYIETDPLDKICINRIVPYLDAFNMDVYGIDTLETYIDNMVNEIMLPSNNIEPSDLKAYLKIVSLCQGSGSIGTGGLLINITSSGVRYVQYTKLSHLLLQHKDFIKEVEKDYNSIMQHEQQEPKKERTKTYARGL